MKLCEKPFGVRSTTFLCVPYITADTAIVMPDSMINIIGNSILSARFSLVTQSKHNRGKRHTQVHPRDGDDDLHVLHSRDQHSIRHAPPSLYICIPLQTLDKPIEKIATRFRYVHCCSKNEFFMSVNEK
jgi:hypothetical protein